jgi:hypothetical protein
MLNMSAGPPPESIGQRHKQQDPICRATHPFERPGDFAEDACNESNYGLEGVLKGARYQDAQAAKVSKTLK